MKSNCIYSISNSLHINIQNDINEYIFKKCLPEYDYFILKYSDKINEESALCFSVYPEICDDIKENWKTNQESENYDLIYVSDMFRRSHCIYKIDNYILCNYILLVKKKCTEELVDTILNQFSKTFGVHPEDIYATLYEDTDDDSTALFYLENKTDRATCAKQSNIRIKELKKELAKEKKHIKEYIRN